MSETLETGEQLGGYEILRPLAAGGMAEVFVARSPVGRLVALKRIRSDLASDEKFVALFLREARIAITLDHPHIAQVLDVGEAEGHYFLVMELVEGISLLALDRAARAHGQRIPLPVVVWIFERIARALHHAHDRRDPKGTPLGIIHRDVSPQNILLDESGGVKLIDFGVARATDAEKLTRPGVTRGKYLYFSPEQIKMGPLDGRSDLFGLGAVLYEVMVGTRAFDGEILDVLRAITHGEFVDPRERDPELPPTLADACGRALRVKREARWSDGEELATVLERWARTHASGIDDSVIRGYLAHVASIELSEAVGHPVPPRAMPQELKPWVRPLLDGPEVSTADVPRAITQPTTAATPVTRFERALRTALIPLVTLGVAALGFGLWWLLQPPPTTGFVGHRPTSPIEAEDLPRPTPPPPPTPAPAPEAPPLPRLPGRPADGSARSREPHDSGWMHLRFELKDALLSLSSLDSFPVKGPGKMSMQGWVGLAGESVVTRKLLLVAQGEQGFLPPRFVGSPGFELPAGVDTLRFVLLNPGSYGTRFFVDLAGEFQLGRPEGGSPIVIGLRQITDPWAYRLPYLRIDPNWRYQAIPRLEFPGGEPEGPRPKAKFLWVGEPVDLVQWSNRTEAGLTGDDLWGMIEEGETLEVDGIGALWFALPVPPEGVSTERGHTWVRIEIKQVGSSTVLGERLRENRKPQRRKGWRRKTLLRP